MHNVVITTTTNDTIANIKVGSVHMAPAVSLQLQLSLRRHPAQCGRTWRWSIGVRCIRTVVWRRSIVAISRSQIPEQVDIFEEAR